MSDHQRARVDLSIRCTTPGEEYGLTIGRGQEVDLDQELGGTPLRELVPADAFDPIDPAERAVEAPPVTSEPAELELGLEEE